MPGLLTNSWSCPRCEAATTSIPGVDGSRYCRGCDATFRLQFGYLLAADSEVPITTQRMGE